jgi:hypothetical protein
VATKNFPTLTSCALCQKNRPLKESHIIPKFFGRELKKRSNSQTLVYGINPEKNPKPQDITKVYLLCEECEGRFSKYENAFRNNVIPANQSLLVPIIYGDWLHKFAVSISWRVLTYLKYAPAYSEHEVKSKELVKFFQPLIADAHGEADTALETWRLYLLDKRTDLGHYNQYFLLLNGKNFPYEYCNTAAFSLFQLNGFIATVAIMGPVIVLGVIKNSSGLKWNDTEIHPTTGQIGITQTIPSSFADWLAALFAEIENVSVEDWKRRRKL